MNITVGPAHVPGAGSGGNRMQNKNGNNDSEIIGKFSVALGLFDYINPIFYGITVITIMANLHGVMNMPAFIFFLLGAILSLIFGLSIPTVKLIVGLIKSYRSFCM